jgi:CRP-like cAMP-binding protein
LLDAPVDGRRLAALDVLAGCSAADLEPVAARLTVKSLAPGDVLMREGEPGDVFALLLAGEVVITRREGSKSRVLARAGEGSILGELGVLRRRPRSATVTAATPVLAAFGGAEVLLQLLGHEAVLERLQHLASARLAHNVLPVPATLPGGVRVQLRPLLPEDRSGYRAAVRSLSPDSRRRRFFSAGRPSAAIVDHLIDIDFIDHFAWLVLRDTTPHAGLATGRYVRDDDDPTVAEVAFGVVDDFQGKGIGTLLLGAVGVAAGEAGIRLMYGHVLEDNTAMLAVFAKAGSRTSFAEPGVRRVEVDSLAASALLDPDLARALRIAVHDVVTAASLAHASPA